MAQTAGGTYYAASSELVSSWPATSLDLANQLESRFAAKAALSSSIIQIVSASTTTAVTSSANTYADTGLTATITPTKSTSKVFVLLFQGGIYKTNLNAASGTQLILLRGSTTLQNWRLIGYTGTAIANVVTHSGGYLDSPATTSATTYKTQFRNEYNGASVVVQDSSSPSTMFLIEIAA